MAAASGEKWRGLKWPGNDDQPARNVKGAASVEPVKIEFGAGADIPTTETAVA